LLEEILEQSDSKVPTEFLRRMVMRVPRKYKVTTSAQIREEYDQASNLMQPVIDYGETFTYFSLRLRKLAWNELERRTNKHTCIRLKLLSIFVRSVHWNWKRRDGITALLIMCFPIPTTWTLDTALDTWYSCIRQSSFSAFLSLPLLLPVVAAIARSIAWQS
jgi:hypothetical protein